MTKNDKNILQCFLSNQKKCVMLCDMSCCWDQYNSSSNGIVGWGSKRPPEANKQSCTPRQEKKEIPFASRLSRVQGRSHSLTPDLYRGLSQGRELAGAVIHASESN